MQSGGWASRVPGVVGVFALALVALGGCAIQVPGEPALTSTAAAAQFYAALDETQDATGGTWTESDDPLARDCVIPLWTPGEQYAGLRIGSAPDDPVAAANSVYMTWRSWGFPVDRSHVGPVIQLQADGLTFRVSSLSMTLQGLSECRPTK